jgi:cytochrome c-type biogenesis protein CcmH/NrfG
MFKKGKVYRKKLLSIVVIALLVGGLLLSATAGFFDFLGGKRNMASSPGDDEYILSLKEQAEILEKALQGDPADLENKAALGSIYYDLAMHCWGRGLQEKETFAVKSKKFLLQVIAEDPLESAATLKIALLAAFILNDETLAEKYFQNSFELQEDNPEAHFYYGVYLFSREKGEEARKHWEKVLLLAEKGSPLATKAQRFLLQYNETDLSKGKQGNNPAEDS